MLANYRRFEAAPDPLGRTWVVEFRWLQNAISIRHSDSVDVKFQLHSGEHAEEKVIALMHTDLLSLSSSTGRSLTDAWCMKLAALHLKYMIETDRDMDKGVVTPSLRDLTRWAEAIEKPQPVRM